MADIKTKVTTAYDIKPNRLIQLNYHSEDDHYVSYAEASFPHYMSTRTLKAGEDITISVVDTPTWKLEAGEDIHVGQGVYAGEDGKLLGREDLSPEPEQLLGYATNTASKGQMVEMVRSPHINGNWRQAINELLEAGPVVDGKDGKDGTKGPKGDAGTPGKKGDTGSTGADGTDGTDGIDGDIGPEGPEGPKGDTGAPGTDGDTGPKGLSGDDGATGLKGTDGDDGSKGDKGVKGDKGDTGPKGTDGTDGDIGPEGPEGPIGPKGEDGKDGEDLTE